MSLVATAIIAGATAAITTAADDVVKSIYQALKSKVAELLSVSFDAIEADPESEQIQKSVETQIRENGLDDIDEIRRLSKSLLDRLDAINANLPDSVLVRVKELVAKGDIEFSNINLNGGGLLDADRVETEGRFSVSGVSGGVSKSSGAAPFVSIGTATANRIDISLNTIAKKFSELPHYVKSIIAIIIILLLVLVAIPVFNDAAGNSQARTNFDEIFKRQRSSMGSEFMSSSNYLTSVIPSNIFQNNDPNHWEKVSYSWNKHSGRMNDFLGPLAACLSEGTCALGEKGEEVCQIAKTQQAAHKNIHDRLESITGINMDYTGGGGGFGGAFGPNVVIPSIQVVNYIADKFC